jgi:ABC-type bacteriocin/lantibiotic exporter with double-glycine peptidase domain
MSTATPAGYHRSPLSRLLGWAYGERHDLWLLAAYGVCTILLTLAAPFAVQVLVNIIAAGVFLQPLFVTVGLLLFALLMAGAFKILQFQLIETLQQRLFAQVALQVANHVPRIDELAFNHLHGPELVNRFFDVMTIQKSLAKLLIVVPTAVIQLLVGFTLLAVYNPLFILFDAALVLFIILVVLLGFGGLRTSIVESIHKYEVASWLQELARCHSSFKLAGLPAYLMERTDRQVTEHIRARQVHFSVILRQTWASYLLQALAHAGLLGVGGWLVIQRNLTIGQLVAAELVMVTMLAALDNLVSNASGVYDLLTGFDKVGHILEIKGEPETTGLTTLALASPSSQAGLGIVCQDLTFGYQPDKPVFNGLSVTIEPDSHTVLVGPSGAGKTTLAHLITGLLPLQSGRIKLDGLDAKTLGSLDIRANVGWVSQEVSLFDGSIEENICMGPLLPEQWPLLKEAMALAHLTGPLETLPEGLRTHVVAEGKNLSFGMRQRIILARALMKQPRLLVLDEALAGLDEQAKQQVMQGLYRSLPHCTVLVITHDPVLIAGAQRLLILDEGQLIGQGIPKGLMRLPDSPLLRLFPSVEPLIAHLESNPPTASTGEGGAGAQ